MARLRSLWLAVLLIAPIPLAAMPTAEATHQGPTQTGTDFTTRLVQSGGTPIAMMLWPTLAAKRAEITFVETSTPNVFEASPPQSDDLTTAAMAGIIRAGDKIQFKVKLANSDATSCKPPPPPPGSVPTAPSTQQDVRHYAIVADTDLFTQSWKRAYGVSLNNQEVTTHLADTSEHRVKVDPKPSTTADASGSHVQKNDLTVTVRQSCVTAGAPESQNKTDIENTITLKNVFMDLTPPNAEPTVQPEVPAGGAGGPTSTPIRKPGDTFSYRVDISDADFLNNPAVCEKYHISAPMNRWGSVADPITISPVTRPQEGATEADLRGGTGPCRAFAVATHVPIAMPSGPNARGYDYDGMSDLLPAANRNLVRIVDTARVVVNHAESDVLLPSTSPLSETVTWNMTDEYGNQLTYTLPHLAIDAVPPRTLEWGADPQPKPGSQAEISIRRDSLSADVVTLVLQKCATSACPGGWQTVQSKNREFVDPGPDRIPDGAQVFITDVTGGLGQGSVSLRVKAIDDAGNEAISAVKTISLDSTTPSFTPSGKLLRELGVDIINPNVKDNTEIVHNSAHPFDFFEFEVADNDLGIAPSPTLREKTMAFARIWQEASPNDKYLVNDALTSSVSADADRNIPVQFVRGVKVGGGVCGAGVTPCGSSDKLERARFRLNLATANLPTGSYHVNFFVRDAAGNERCMFGEVDGTPTGCCITPTPANCLGGIVLERDIKDPSYVFGESTTDYRGGSFNRIAAFPDLPGAPGVQLNAVQQGTFLPVSLKVLDEGTGFQNITFRFVTGAGFDKIATTTFGVPAVACLRTYAFSATDVQAIARIPVTTSDCRFVPTQASLRPPNDPPAGIVRKMPTATPGSVESYSFETTSCAGVRTSTCAVARTPYVNVSTDGIPFGSYKLQIVTTDWSGRSKSLLMGETFSVVPRVVAEPGATKQDGKISVVVYAGYSDDANARGACDVKTHTPTTVASKTGVCEPNTVTFEYLPVGATDTDANYRPLKVFNVAPPPKTLVYPVLEGKLARTFEPYGRVETPVGFYKYEIKDFTPPSDVQLREPPELRVTVTAANFVNGVESTTGLVRIKVPLGSTDLVDDFLPRKPFTDWLDTREPTFYRAPGTTDPGTVGSSRLADLTFEMRFNAPEVLPRDTAVWYKIYDQGLNFTYEGPGTDTGATRELVLHDLKPGFHYFRVAAVKDGVESPFSATRVVPVGRPGIALPQTIEPSPVEAPVTTAPTSGVLLAAGQTDADVTLAWNEEVAGATATTFRVYHGVDKALYASGKVPPTFSCDLTRPSNGTRPCRMVYWSDGRSDAYDNKGIATGRNWIARVNVSMEARWEDANNPGDPDAPPRLIVVDDTATTGTTANVLVDTDRDFRALGVSAGDIVMTWTQTGTTRSNVQRALVDAVDPADARRLILATSGAALSAGMRYSIDRKAPDMTMSREVDLPRGLYVLETTAHTKTSTGVSPRDIAYLARKFRIETVAPQIEALSSTTQVFGNQEWTTGSPSFDIAYDVGHFVKTTEANISVGIQLVESNARSWVPAPTRVRAVNLAPISVVAVATTNIPLSAAPPSKIDDVTFGTQPVLLTNQQVPQENGVYTVSGGVWTRAVNARTEDDLQPGLVVNVLRGERNTGSGWILVTSAVDSNPSPSVFTNSAPLTFTKYTTGFDGATLQRYSVSVDLGGYTHGTAFSVFVNLTANNKTLVAPAFPLVRSPRVLTLDLTGPTVLFDLKHKVVNGGEDSSNLVDGDPVFHGKVTDGIGSGVVAVQFAVKEVDTGEFFDGKSFKAALENLPNWRPTDALAPGSTANEKVWKFTAPAGLVSDIKDDPSNYVIYARGIDELGNRGKEITATPIVDGRPPVLGANGTLAQGNRDEAYTPRAFAIVATDGTPPVADEDEMSVSLHLLPPSGRLLTFPMETAGGSTCAAASASSCWAVELEDELGWVGDVSYYFSSVDAAGNAFCSYGPCDSDAATRPAFDVFSLVDNGAPIVDSVVLQPRVPAAGGSVTAVADIREAANFLEGYPKAYFYVNGVEVANRTMVEYSAEAVDPSSGAGLWKMSTLEAGIDLVENQTVRVVVIARDTNDLVSDPKSVSAVVSANVAPVVTLASPPTGTAYVGKRANVKVHVEDVNLDPRGFTVEYAIEGGAAVRDTNPANVTAVTPLVTLGKTLAWEFTYVGGDFPDGANVTLTFGARDNLSATGSVVLNATVDAVGPTVGASVSPQASSDAGTTYVGPLTTVTLEATDSVTPSAQIRLEYSVNGGSTTVYTGPVTVTGGDTFSMTYAAVDLAGNRAEGTPISFAIDKTPPVVSVVSSGANTTITATDALVGVDPAKVRLFYKTSSSGAFTEFPFDHTTGNTYTATLGALSGTFIYYVEVADKLGNVGRATVGSVTCSAETPCGLVDSGTARPVITFVTPQEGATIRGPVDVKWTASASTAAPTIKLEIANSTGRVLVKDALGLEGTTSLDPTALGLGAGDWTLVLTIDDGVNPPVTASRNVAVDLTPEPSFIGTPETAPPATMTVGQTYTSRIPIEDERVSKVRATIVRNNAVVRTVEYEVVDGSIAFSFGETAPGNYQVRLTPIYADGTSGETRNFPGVFRVQAAGTSEEPSGGHIVQVSALVVVGALVVALAAVGAFKRWK